MTRTDLRTYTPEFRAEAVKLVLEQGLSLEAAARRLSIPKGTLANWVMAAKRGATTLAPGSRSVAELEHGDAGPGIDFGTGRLLGQVIAAGGWVGHIALLLMGSSQCKTAASFLLATVCHAASAPALDRKG